MVIDYDGLIEHLRKGSEPFGLLTMQSTSTTGRLIKQFPDRLKALFSAEHGFFGIIAPGEKAESAWHSYWDRPIHSLYGEHRKPTQEMLEGLGRIVIDLTDIGVRCYTYLATLKNTLEACSEAGISVTVLDRPIPYGGMLDGPMLTPALTSFVAPINVPLCHRMTPGECSIWIRDQLGLQLDLDVIKVLSWNHEDRNPWQNFIPPSPAIRSWDCALMYPLTVFTEAYPAVDCDRGGSLAFRVIGAPWMHQKELIEELEPGLLSCGVSMRPYRYNPSTGKYCGHHLDGILFSVSSGAKAFYPVTAGAMVLAALAKNYGEQVFNDSRNEWMDKLAGSSSFREVVCNGGDLNGLFQSWLDDRNEYLKSIVNLYQ